MARRTPKLTALARTVFEREYVRHGWQPGHTIPVVARATGLTLDQVRDSLFTPPADEWRRAFAAQRREVH